MGIVATQGFRYRGVPKELILSAKLILNCNSFIETGSYLGETAYWASENFKRVISIEASKELYDNLKPRSNIQFVYGDSSKKLRDFIEINSVIYLDAHYPGGHTFNNYPLLDELTILNNADTDHIIIVDDARFCLAKWGNEKYGSLTEIISLLSKDNKRYVVCIDDMLIAAPMKHSDWLDEYTNNLSIVYWETFLNENLVNKKYNANSFRYVKYVKMIWEKIIVKILR